MRRFSVVICICIFLSACGSLFYVQETADYSLVGQPEFNKSLAQAKELNDELQGKINNLHTFETATGLLLLGTALAGAGLGFFDGSRDALIGVALGGAAVTGVRIFAPSAELKDIYLSGQKAITCSRLALTVNGQLKSRSISGEQANTGEETSAGSRVGKEVDSRGAGLSEMSGISNLRGRFNRFISAVGTSERRKEFDGGTRDTTFRLTTAVRLLKEAAVGAKASLAEIEDVASDQDRAEAMIGALEAIRTAVNSQISRKTFDSNAAIEAANGSIGSFIQTTQTVVKDAKKKVEDFREQATRTKVVGEVVENLSPNSVDKAAAMKAAPTAKEAENLANEADEQLNKILELSQLPPRCVRGLF